MSTSNPLTIEYTEALQAALKRALRRDGAMDMADWEKTWDAARTVPVGTQLPYELPDGSDGETDAERVSIALDYYSVA